MAIVLHARSYGYTTGRLKKNECHPKQADFT